MKKYKTPKCRMIFVPGDDVLTLSVQEVFDADVVVANDKFVFDFD